MKNISLPLSISTFLWLWNGWAMAQTSSRVLTLSLQDQLPPLTMPADCLTTREINGETGIQGVSDNIYVTTSTLHQGCSYDDPRTTCCPSYESAGYVDVYYSPGVCPDGYTTLED